MTQKKIGKGLMDIIKDPIGWVKDISSPIPTRLNNVSTSTLKQYGSDQIDSLIQLIRTPLSDTWTGALNKISFGNYNKIQGNDPLYHVAMIVISKGQRIIIEKNEVINVNIFKSTDVNNKTEWHAFHINKKISINEMLNNTLKYMGPEKFYDYSAMSSTIEKRNNCQDFIKSILLSNGIANEYAINFIYQNIDHLENGFQKNKVGYVPHVVKGITSLGSRVSRIIGKGLKTKKAVKNHEKLKLFMDFVKNDGFRML